jgi:hypothetical protein
MFGPHFCSMKIIEDVRQYAAAQRLSSFLTEVRLLIQSGRCSASSDVNALQVMTNFEIAPRSITSL